MVASTQPESESGDEEDDGLQIDWPIAMVINVTAVILLVALWVRWVGCR